MKAITIGEVLEEGLEKLPADERFVTLQSDRPRGRGSWEKYGRRFISTSLSQDTINVLHAQASDLSVRLSKRFGQDVKVSVGVIIDWLVFSTAKAPPVTAQAPAKTKRKAKAKL